MRPRFSLRSLLAATTLLALFLYYWVIMPTRTAEHFIRAVNSQDYATADKLVGDTRNFDLMRWKVDRWGLTTETELEPLSLSQILQGGRNVNMRMKYFQLDELFDMQIQLTATSHGMKNFRTIKVLPKAVIDTSQRGRILDTR